MTDKALQLYTLKKEKDELEKEIKKIQEGLIEEWKNEKRIPIDDLRYFTVIDNTVSVINNSRLIQSIGQTNYNKVSSAKKSAIQKQLGTGKVTDLIKKGIIKIQDKGKYLRLVEQKGE